LTRNRVLELLNEELELEGFTPGTPEFERLLLSRKVHKCQEMQNTIDCPSCRAFIDCETARQYLMTVRFGGTK
jgi:hypothetical protein